MSRYDEITLKELGAQVVVVASHLDVDTKFMWTAFNPSVCKIGDKIYIAIRSSNYLIMPDGQYALYDYGDFLNRLWIGELTPQLAVTNMRRLEQADLEMRRGMEDPRLFVRDGKVVMACIALENWIPKARVVEVSVGNELTTLDDIKVLEGPDPKRVEKNWMPVHEITAEFDYLYSTQMTYKVNGGFTKVQPQVEIPSGLRGGSQLIEHEGGLIGVMHQTLIFSEMQKFSSATFTMENVQRRKYKHYLVKMDMTGSITEVSRAFYFTQPGVEFCSGIVRVKDGFILSYGHEDREARVAHVTDGVVERLFRTQD